MTFGKNHTISKRMRVNPPSLNLNSAFKRIRHNSETNEMWKFLRCGASFSSARLGRHAPVAAPKRAISDGLG
jgi:hypothetical protein